MRLGSATLYDPTPRGNYPRRGSLSDAVVVKMRLEYARGYKSSYQLAAEHGVSQATVQGIIQGSTYKAAGGLITWPNGRYARPLPKGKVRGHCWDVACDKPIAPSGHAQRMHLCVDCFRLNGGRKSGRYKTGKMRSKRCPICGASVQYYYTPGRWTPKTCSSPECRARQLATSKSKRPIDLTNERLRELYVVQNMTAPEISALYGNTFTKHSVQLWLIAADIPRKTRRRTVSQCIWPGCNRAVDQKWNGVVWYGRHCRQHQNQRDRATARKREHLESETRGELLASIIHRLLAGLPDSVRRDAEGDITLAVLDRTLDINDLNAVTVKPFITRAFRENADQYRFLSIQAPCADGEGVQTWGQRLGLS